MDKILTWAENDINRVNVLAAKRGYYQRKITMTTAQEYISAHKKWRPIFSRHIGL